MQKMASSLGFHQQSIANKNYLFTIFKVETPAPTPPSLEEADPHFFLEPLSDLQGPFLLEVGDRYRIYEDEAKDWYCEENDKPDHTSPQLRIKHRHRPRQAEPVYPFVRWCAAAAIKH